MVHLRKITPIRHVDVVRVPILLIHGIEDTSRAGEAIANHECEAAARPEGRCAMSSCRGAPLAVVGVDPDPPLLQEIEEFLAASLNPR